ncbi:MAG: hypothetical protein KDC24_05790 [Saprospiraceae bacterium]|nr:hypothetical protein [Saprospiraceae bacterium]
MTTNNSQQRLIAIASVIVVALLGVAIFLLVSNINKGKALEEKAMALEQSAMLADSLENQYNDAIIELDNLKGDNEELNAIIEQQKAELAEQKTKINSLIRSRKDLDQARAEIKNLTAQVNDYIAQVNQLKDENAELTDQNLMLSENLSQEKMQNEELQTAKAALVSEKQQLETEKTYLTDKVTFASVIKVSGFEIEGYKLRDTDKKSKKRYAKNVDQVEVCFNVAENKVANPGVETFYVRIINPVGETVAAEQRTIVNKETGSEILYTEKLQQEYDNEAEKVCFNWVDPNGFQQGTYEVELYNKGFLAGKSSFRLK